MIETLTPILLDNQQCPPHSRQHSTWPSICTHGPINGHVVSFSSMDMYLLRDSEHGRKAWNRTSSTILISSQILSYAKSLGLQGALNYDICRIGELRLQLRLTATLPRKLLHWASLDLRFCSGTIAATTWLCGCKGTRISRCAWDEVAINNIK